MTGVSTPQLSQPADRLNPQHVKISIPKHGNTTADDSCISAKEAATPIATLGSFCGICKQAGYKDT